MTLRVLILCQRKSTTLPKDSDYVDETVEIINTFIEENFGENVDIEYLTTHEHHQGNSTDETNYVADYKFALNNNREALEFVAKHKGKFDGIILNTCPINYMNYKMINELLKVGGFVLLKSFAPQDEDGEIRLQEINILNSTLKTLNKYFTYKTPHDFGSHYYIKGNEAGKRTRKKVKRSKVIRRKVKRTQRRHA